MGALLAATAAGAMAPAWAVPWTDLAAVGAAAALCGLWVAVQQWVARRDPCQPGVEGNCGCKGWKSEAGGSCKRREGGGEVAGGVGGDLVQFPSRH